MAQTLRESNVTGVIPILESFLHIFVWYLFETLILFHSLTQHYVMIRLNFVILSFTPSW